MDEYERDNSTGTLQEILRSGDLIRIRDLNLEIVVEHFGTESFEYLAVQQRLADERAALQPPPRRYKVPAFSESPLTNRNMLRRWIRLFAEMNGLDLPSGFYKKDRRQLVGMYRGMIEHYGIDPEETTLGGNYWKK